MRKKEKGRERVYEGEREMGRVYVRENEERERECLRERRKNEERQRECLRERKRDILCIFLFFYGEFNF